MSAPRRGARDEVGGLQGAVAERGLAARVVEPGARRHGGRCRQNSSRRPGSPPPAPAGLLAIACPVRQEPRLLGRAQQHQAQRAAVGAGRPHAGQVQASSSRCRARPAAARRHGSAAPGTAGGAPRHQPRLRHVSRAARRTSAGRSRPCNSDGRQHARSSCSTRGRRAGAAGGVHGRSSAIRPSFSTSTRSASVTASTTSWVISTVVNRSRAPDPGQEVVHLHPGQRVERAERLVEQEQPRPADQGARQGDALALAAGQDGRPVAGRGRPGRHRPATVVGPLAPVRAAGDADIVQRRAARAAGAHPGTACARRRGRPVKGRPSSSTSPALAVSRPASSRSSVLLPPPERPTMATNRPASISRSMPRRTAPLAEALRDAGELDRQAVAPAAVGNGAPARLGARAVEQVEGGAHGVTARGLVGRVPGEAAALELAGQRCRRACPAARRRRCPAARRRSAGTRARSWSCSRCRRRPRSSRRRSGSAT